MNGYMQIFLFLEIWNRQCPGVKTHIVMHQLPISTLVWKENSSQILQGLSLILLCLQRRKLRKIFCKRKFPWRAFADQFSDRLRRLHYICGALKEWGSRQSTLQRFAAHDLRKNSGAGPLCSVISLEAVYHTCTWRYVADMRLLNERGEIQMLTRRESAGGHAHSATTKLIMNPRGHSYCLNADRKQAYKCVGHRIKCIGCQNFRCKIYRTGVHENIFQFRSSLMWLRSRPRIRHASLQMRSVGALLLVLGLIGAGLVSCDETFSAYLNGAWSSPQMLTWRSPHTRSWLLCLPLLLAHPRSKGGQLSWSRRLLSLTVLRLL